MLYTGLFKRIIPFVVTFAAGLFLASFFVSVALPSLSNMREVRRSRSCHEKRQLRMERDELRDKVRTLRRQNEELRRNATDIDVLLQEAVPPVELDAPHPPPPPRVRGTGTGYGSGSGSGYGTR
jgi:hypothetical protein